MLIALIPARSGSKGIKNKNIKIFCGKPLIQWSIESALNAPFVDRVIVSTDSKDYADLAKSLGAEVPFIRPDKYSQDDSPSIDFILHALEEIPEAKDILLLQPTSPLRDHKDIESYFIAKSILFEMLRPDAIAIVNNSASFGKRIIKKCKSHHIT